jgi:hypothetical protein
MSVNANPGVDRVGKIRVKPYAGLSVDVSIYQEGAIKSVYAAKQIISQETVNTLYTSTETVIADVSLNNLPASSVVDVSINITFNAINEQTTGGSSYNPYASIIIKDSSNLTVGTYRWLPGEQILQPGVSGGNSFTLTRYIKCEGLYTSQFPLEVNIINIGEWVGNPPHPDEHLNEYGTSNITVSIMSYKYSGPQLIIYNQPVNIVSNVNLTIPEI